MENTRITRKSNKVMFFRVFSLVLAFGLLFIGCERPDSTDIGEAEDITAKPKTKISTLEEINQPSDAQEMKEALEANAEALELDLTVYNMLSEATKTAAAQYVLENKPYADEEAIKEAFADALQAAATAEKNLLLKFEITPQGDTDKDIVEASFNAVHNYIQAVFTTDTTQAQSIIKLGDYIDLPSLSVAGDTGHETEANYGYINSTSDLRLVVIDINSFNGKNGNNTPHLVFHFKDIPGFHKMNGNKDNTTGYLNSEMRSYITGNFLSGLKDAGVPEEVLWAPERIVASSGIDETATEQTITDKLWLPTAWEMTGEQSGSVASCETSSNQASFTEFYRNDDARKNPTTNSYFLASPSSGLDSGFCVVHYSGVASANYADSVGGCVPAFCVQ
ncbi:MAG: hypothetical protein Ta2G_11720 [Termitinemataceae bacterium]|nr:MAG: hypothetical protein Ta2G_11720 [Termitinemataceae bacterium]